MISQFVTVIGISVSLVAFLFAGFCLCQIVIESSECKNVAIRMRERLLPSRKRNVRNDAAKVARDLFMRLAQGQKATFHLPIKIQADHPLSEKKEAFLGLGTNYFKDDTGYATEEPGLGSRLTREACELVGGETFEVTAKLNTKNQNAIAKYHKLQSLLLNAYKMGVSDAAAYAGELTPAEIESCIREAFGLEEIS